MNVPFVRPEERKARLEGRAKDGAGGLTLIEVLVSLLLVSLLLLNLDAVNLASLKITKAIWYYQLAEWQAQNMQEYLRAGQGRVSNQQIEEWNQQNEMLLPKGRGQIDTNRITVSWGNLTKICDKNIISINGCVVSLLSKY